MFCNGFENDDNMLDYDDDDYDQVVKYDDHDAYEESVEVR